MRAALVYGSKAGVGGLGHSAACAVAGLARGLTLDAVGPGYTMDWPVGELSASVRWHEMPRFLAPSRVRFTWRRWLQGRSQLDLDTRMGRWAATRLAALKPDRCYAFTQVALETLQWARAARIPTTLDNPNGHIRNFALVLRTEAEKWCGGVFLGHPTQAMVQRVEQEYDLADRIRVLSMWAKASMVKHGVSAEKVHVLNNPIDLRRFRPPASKPKANGPLRVCYVGSLDLRKGFPYLLRAARLIGPHRIEMELVGGTGDRWCRRLLARERAGLHVLVAPGDPVAAYHRAEVFVMPSLEDGFGYVVGEAMASALPVITTLQCGGAEWIEPGETGWVVAAADAEALAAALEDALVRRHHLRSMGEKARSLIEDRAGVECLNRVRDWFLAA